MDTPISNLDTLIRSMHPELHDGIYCFAPLPEDTALPASAVIASIREPEGLSVVVREEDAARYSLDAPFKAAWITLTVHSDLAAVGLTAAFADALGKAGISCNVVAGTCHDHIFVPAHQAHLAMQTLKAMQQNA